MEVSTTNTGYDVVEKMFQSLPESLATAEYYNEILVKKAYLREEDIHTLGDLSAFLSKVEDIDDSGGTIQ